MPCKKVHFFRKKGYPGGTPETAETVDFKESVDFSGIRHFFQESVDFSGIRHFFQESVDFSGIRRFFRFSAISGPPKRFQDLASSPKTSSGPRRDLASSPKTSSGPRQDLRQSRWTRRWISDSGSVGHPPTWYLLASISRRELATHIPWTLSRHGCYVAFYSEL